jgi:hypothetical protein
LVLPIFPRTSSPTVKVLINYVTGRFTGDAKRDFTEGLAVGDEEKCPVSGKRKYWSEGEALATAVHQIATARAPKELRAYRCSWCEAWHLTKNAGKGDKERG